jgi:hypothetical protein
MCETTDIGPVRPGESAWAVDSIETTSGAAAASLDSAHPCRSIQLVLLSLKIFQATFVP